MPNRRFKIVAFGAVLVGALAMACGSDSPAAAPTARPATPTVQPRSTEAPPTPVPAATTAPATQTQTTPATVPDEGSPFTWEIEDVDSGTKPALALTADGTPNVAYMLEAMPGFVKNAVRSGASWDISTIAKGYFYGPLDIGIGPDDTPHITYHDHQANNFQPSKGDAVHAVLKDGEWKVEAVFDVGHDGWDNRLIVDAQGRVHMSAIDPVEFGGSGVEYYFQDDSGKWEVEQVDSGPQTYKYATSVAVDPNGAPHITYFDQSRNDLVLASRNDGDWTKETVDSEGDSGLFSSLVIGADGRYHVSYLFKGATFGAFKYATRGPDDTEWVVTEIDRLNNLKYGFVGARNITSLALDSEGRPWITYSDEKHLKLAVWDGSEWGISTVVDAGSKTQGQLVSLGLDADDQPHIAYFEVTNKSPLDGVIKYAKGTPG
ncbi:MAG: hypothetical protein O3A47_09725 [Chloroflexi bacterium]|nr:hypothetical protein [Chloroflexota bacterium]